MNAGFDNFKIVWPSIVKKDYIWLPVPSNPIGIYTSRGGRKIGRQREMSSEGQRLYLLPRVGEIRAEVEPTVIQVISRGMPSHRHMVI